MKVAIRADSSIEIGTGHIMRCMALAEQLKAKGDEVHFISREHEGHLQHRIRQAGYECHLLSLGAYEKSADYQAEKDLPLHSAWLGSDWISDARETAAILAFVGPDWLVVDHYSLDERWEREVASKDVRVMVIDDLADRPHYCDLLLDQNPGKTPTHYSSLIPDNCALLLGPDYALLRSEFGELREASLARRKGAGVDKILISMGGGDKDNITGEVVECLKLCALSPQCVVTVVMGVLSSGLQGIEKQIEDVPFTVKLRADVKDMAQLMLESDLAIGAAGTTALERCCLGLPSVVVILAENQRAGAKAMESQGVARVIEHPGRVRAELCGIIDGLNACSESIEKLSQNASQLTDGNGASRVGNIMRERAQSNA